MATDTMTLTSARPRQASVRTGTHAADGVGTSLTRFLGWFSIGLGVSEIVAPGMIARISGTSSRKNVVRLFGLREVSAGVGILTHPRPARWLWARVAGDVLDIAAIAGGSKPGGRGASASALAAVAGVTALDILCAKHVSDGAKTASDRAEASVLIARSPEEIYSFWRDLANFPRFIKEIRSVHVTGEKTSHWTAQLPHRIAAVEWDSEIVEETPNERISWRTTPRAGVTIDGSATFEPAPGGRGTIVRVQLDYDHPGRKAVAPLSKLVGKHPEQVAYKALRRLKSLLEVGEIITTEGQSAGRRQSTTWLDAIAR